MPPEQTGPDEPEGEEPITQVVDSADMVEETDLTEEPAAAPDPPTRPVAMPPPRPHRATPPATPAAPPATPAPAPIAAAPPATPDAVEELSAEDLTETDAPGARDGVIEAALAAARKTLDEGGGAARIAFYEAEIAAWSRGEVDKGRVALYQHEVGELLEDGGDEGAAVKAYAKALQSDATLKPNLWAIRRVFQRRALWPNLLKLLDAEIRFAKSDPEKAELYVEKGQLLEDQLGDAAQAKDCYIKATVAHPGAVAAWMALEKIHTRAGDLGGLTATLRGLASATQEPGRKVALLLDLARLQESAGGSLDQAIELCGEAYQATLEPDLQERALDQLERMAEPAGRTEDVLRALEARALMIQQTLPNLPVGDRLAGNDRLVGIRRRQAQLVRELADGPKRAWEYLEDAIKFSPVEPLLQRDLAELAQALGRWDELAILLGKRLEAEGGDAKTRLSLQLERADALRKAGRGAEAEAVEAEVAREAPQHLGLLVSRERDALKLGDWDRLASLYLGEGEAALGERTPTGQPDPTWAATAFTQAGTLLGDKSARDAEAQAALKRALEARPGFRPAIDALERLYERAGKPTEQAALIEDELKAEPPPSKERARRLYETLIAVRETGLDDPAGAAQAARRLAELRPDDVRVRLRLIELDRAAARWQDAADDLAGLAKILPEERRLEALVARAEILERRLADEPGALKAYREALQLRPGEPRAAEAFEAISRRRSGRKAHATPEPQAKPSPQAWDDLAAALKREVEASLSPERVASVLLKLGEIHERERGQFNDAAQTYRDLLDRAPGHAAALRGLERAYAALGDDAHLAQALEQEVEAITDGGSRAAALTLLGEHYEDRLKDDEPAEDAYGRALAAGPAPHAALGRFRTAVRRRDAAAQLAALGQLDAIGGEGARAQLLDERAWAQRLAGEQDAAGGLVREALAQSSGVSQSSRLQRARLAARGGEVGELAQALDALAVNAAEPVLQGALERRAGMLELARGADGHEAAALRLRQGQALLPQDPELVVALCDVVSDPDVLQQRIPLAAPEAQPDWMIERAETLEAMGRLGDAARELERALAADPRHLTGLELARRLARAGEDARGFAAATARLAAVVLDAERSAALHAEAGEAFEKLGLRDEAASAWRAVLDRTPLDGLSWNRARALLEQLHAEKKQPGPLVELYTHRLAHVTDLGDRATLYLERAELLAGEGDRDGAEADLRAVLADNPEQLGAMRRLADLLAQTPPGRMEAQVLLLRYLDLETASEHRRAALLRVAEIEEATQPERAIEHLEAAIELAPSPAQSLPDRERLAALLVRQRRWQHAVQALAKVAELSPDGPARAAVEIRVSAIYQDGFADPRAAVEALNRALKSEPLELAALQRLVQHAESGHLVQLELDDKLERAIRVARQRLAANPGDLLAHQAMARLWGWRADEDARQVAAQALALAKGERPTEREDVIDPTKELTPVGWERLLPEAARTVALEIWRLGWEASMKIYGPSIEALGVGKADRVNAKTLPPAWAHVDKVARALGLGAGKGYELYAARDRETCASGAHDEMPVLVCGGAYSDRLTPRLRFHLARAATLLRDRLGPLEKLDAGELSTFFCACAKVAELPRPAGLTVPSEGAVDERARQVGKALGRKERKAMTALGARFGELGDPAAWRRAVLDGAARSALVVCGDLGAALAALGLGAPHTDLHARELMLFALSEEYLALRREMGLRS